jgi:hypothetical protein
MFAATFGSLVQSGGLTRLWPKHGGQDWQGAMAAVRSTVQDSSTPVLVSSGFVESMDPKQFFDPNRTAILLSPLSVYPAAGRVIMLPVYPTDRSLEYLASVSASTLEPSRRFVLVSNGENKYENWLAGRFARLGFRRRRVGDFGENAVILFERYP